MVKTGNPNYTMQFRDWGIVKGALKLMLNNLRTLDMNIIVNNYVNDRYSISLNLL